MKEQMKFSECLTEYLDIRDELNQDDGIDEIGEIPSYRLPISVEASHRKRMQELLDTMDEMIDNAGFDPAD